MAYFFCLFVISVSSLVPLTYSFGLPCLHQLFLWIFCLNYIREKILSRTVVDSPKRKSNWTSSPFKAWSHIFWSQNSSHWVNSPTHTTICFCACSCSCAKESWQSRHAHTSRINFKGVLVHLGHGKKYIWIFQLEFCYVIFAYTNGKFGITEGFICKNWYAFKLVFEKGMEWIVTGQN